MWLTCSRTCFYSCSSVAVPWNRFKARAVDPCALEHLHHYLLVGNGLFHKDGDHLDITMQNWGMNSTRCQRIDLPSCGELFYFWPFTSLVSMFEIIAARQANDQLPDLIKEPQSLEKARSGKRYEKHQKSKIVGCVAFSGLWWFMMCCCTDLKIGSWCYVLYFMPHQFALAQGEVASGIEDIYMEYCKDRIDQLCKLIDDQEADCAPDFWADRAVEYDKLAEMFEQVARTMNSLRLLNWLNLAAVVVSIFLLAMVSTNIFFGIACSLAIVGFVSSFVGYMWKAAQVTNMCQGRTLVPPNSMTNGLVKYCLVGITPKIPPSIQQISSSQLSKRRGMSQDARLAHLQFLQHVCTLQIGMRGPFGTVTTGALLNMLRATVSIVPLAVAIQRRIQNEDVAELWTQAR